LKSKPLFLGAVHLDAEPRGNMTALRVENPWNLFAARSRECAFAHLRPR